MNGCLPVLTEVDYTTAGWNSLSTAAPDGFHNIISDIKTSDKTKGISHYYYYDN
jgi:hypothetical protein